jgi:hypothetical protein
MRKGARRQTGTGAYGNGKRTIRNGLAQSMMIEFRQGLLVA